MRSHASDVSATASGDYYQLSLGSEESTEAEADPYEVSGPYLIVQRQFEMADQGQCYIETHDESYIGPFRLRLAELTRTRLTGTNVALTLPAFVEPTKTCKPRSVFDNPTRSGDVSGCKTLQCNQTNQPWPRHESDSGDETLARFSDC